MVVFTTLVGLILADFGLAERAHKKLLANNAHFAEKYQALNADFMGPHTQGCEVENIYFI